MRLAAAVGISLVAGIAPTALTSAKRRTLTGVPVIVDGIRPGAYVCSVGTAATVRRIPAAGAGRPTTPAEPQRGTPLSRCCSVSGNHHRGGRT